MRLKKYQWYLVVLNALMLLLTAFKPETFYLIAAICLLCDLIVYCLLDLSNHVFLFAFLLAFFVFLMGREILDIFNLHTIVSQFPTEINIHAEKLLLISLISLTLGYWTSRHLKIASDRDKDVDYDAPIILYIRSISIFLFYITLFFSIIQLLDVGRYMLSHGYLATYTSYSSNLPYLLVKLADIAPISFWIFLATMPSKKTVNHHSVLFFLYLAMTLLTGKRFTFVAGILVLFTYYSMRNTIRNEGEKWIKKRSIIVCALLIPVGTMALYMFSRIRLGNAIDGTGAMDAITDFFYSQGVSINVIKYSKMYELDPSKKYLFSSLMTFLQKNAFARLFDIQSYSGNTVENAINGNSLAHAMSYLLYGSRYLGGRGIGSCYIAEAFHDYGYAGVIVVNFIYGTVICKFFNFRKKGVYTAAISLILLNSILFAPRGSADGFVTDIVDFTTWGTIIGIYIISHILLRSRTTESSHTL